MDRSRLSSTSAIQRTVTHNPFCDRPNTGLIKKFSDTNPYYYEYRRQKYKEIDAKNKKLKAI